MKSHRAQLITGIIKCQRAVIQHKPLFKLTVYNCQHVHVCVYKRQRVHVCICICMCMRVPVAACVYPGPHVEAAVNFSGVRMWVVRQGSLALPLSSPPAGWPAYFSSLLLLSPPPILPQDFWDWRFRQLYLAFPRRPGIEVGWSKLLWQAS